MLYAYTSINESPRFAAFEDEAEANQWLIDEIGSDYERRIWIDGDGKLHRDSKWFPDFGADVFPSLERAIEAFAGLDPSAAIRIIRMLLDVAETAEDG